MTEWSMSEWDVRKKVVLRDRNLKWVVAVVLVVVVGLSIGFLVGSINRDGSSGSSGGNNTSPENANNPPVITSSYFPPGNTVTLGSSVTLGISASDPDGDSLTYSWHCDKDPTINAQTENEFLWTPPSSGTYHITVSVSDGVNPPVVYSIDITVGTLGVPPTAEISGPSEGKAGTAVSFSGSGSTDPDGTIVEYRWDFGDGSTGSGREVTHTFSQPGTYNVSLTVVDNTGLEDSAVLVISILEHPSPPYDVEAYFIPSGWMGDIGDITLNTSSTENPLSGDTCIEITYTPSGGNKWAGIYWQYPEHNWGDYKGWDFTGATKLTFWARGKNGGEKSEFKVGGIWDPSKPYRDSIYPAVTTGVLVLSSDWHQYTIDLSGRDLSNVIGGFVWVSNKNSNPSGCTIYLDNILFEA